jgi:hypothetical protein
MLAIGGGMADPFALPPLDLAILGQADPVLHDLLLETCGARKALATTILRGIATTATQRAIEHERARVEAHLLAGENGGRAWQIARNAIREGTMLTHDMLSTYRAAISEIGTTKLRVLPHPTTTTGDRP